MSNKPSMLDRTAERIMDLDSPAYGDERERTVFMESNAFGLTIGMYLGLLSALIASLFGLLLLPVVLLVVTLLPSAAAHWYAKRRGVNLQKLAEKAGTRSTMIEIVVFGSAMVLTCAGMAFTLFAGYPLIPVPTIQVTPGEGLLGGMAQGATIGGMIGGLAAVIGGMVSFRRVQHHRNHPIP